MAAVGTTHEKFAEKNGIDSAVADLTEADFGRRDIRLAEHEMPGLMALRRQYSEAKPLHGARISGSLHMTIQTAVLIETLVEGTAPRSAGRPATSSPPRTTRPRRSSWARTGPPRSPRESPASPGRARRWRSTRWCAEQMLAWRDSDTRGPNMILDDGGDATMLVHKGVEFEKAGVVPTTELDDPAEYQVVLETLRRSLADYLQHWDGSRRRASRASPRRPRRMLRPPVRVLQRGQAALPGELRQRLGHQVEVRQQVRLPPLADRRHQPRRRRAALRARRPSSAASVTSARARPSRCGARAPGRPSPRPTPSARSRRSWRATTSTPSRTSSSSPTSSSRLPATRTSSPSTT